MPREMDSARYSNLFCSGNRYGRLCDGRVCGLRHKAELADSPLRCTRPGDVLFASVPKPTRKTREQGNATPPPLYLAGTALPLRCPVVPLPAFQTDLPRAG